MKNGLVLVGEPMGLLIAQTEGCLNNVSSYDLAVAGAEFNVAIGTARLEHKVTYMTKLGDDPFGKRITTVLKDNKIGDEFISFSKERATGFMLKSRTSVGDPEIFYFRKNSAASTLNEDDVEKIDLSNYGYIHLTGILPALSEDTKKATFSLIKKAKKQGLFISFDPNLRPQLWKSQEEMIQTINELASYADLVLPGKAEGKILIGTDDEKEINDFYLQNGASICVTKCGSKGAYVSTKDREGYMVEGYKVEKVVDTVGAGDGFATGVVTGLMEGLTLSEAVKRGTAIGAIQVMSRGDNEGLPTRQELKDFMNK
mgnify:FL=1